MNSFICKREHVLFHLSNVTKSLFYVSNLIPHCKKWCSLGRCWVWWDVGVAVGPRGTCFPWCGGWRCLCVGSTVPSYLSEHTEASWHWQSPGWSEVSFWCTGTSWWSQVTPWHAGTTSSLTMSVDLIRCTAKTKTTGRFNLRQCSFWWLSSFFCL